jgi:putative pyrroloquinoline-quinone binding quinoprotein/putative pyrroloquinoline-quinone-binding quinoprotein
MSDEFGNLAQTAANALVSAMATDYWQAVKHGFAAVARRDRQLEDTRAALVGKSGSELETAKSAETDQWVTRLRDLLADDPGKEQALRAFLVGLSVTPKLAPQTQSQHAQGGATVFGDVTGNAGNINIGNAGDVNIGSGKIDKRRYRFFLPPVLFSHMVQQVTTHWVVSTVTVVVVIGGASTGLALAHKGANTLAPSPTVSASTPAPAPAPPAQSSASWGTLQGGPDRTGAQSDETRIGTGNVSKLSQVRTYKTNSETGESTAPLIANGILYVATNQLYAFDATGAAGCSAAPATCTPLWTAPTAYIHGMAIANGHVFVTDGEGVQAYDAAGSENCSGTPKVCSPLWATSTHTTTGPAFVPGPGSPVVANGVLYVPGGGDGIAPNLGGAYVAAFDTAGTTGCAGTPTICVPMWTTTGLPGGTGNAGSPAIAGGVLYIANESLYAFDATGSTDCSGTPKVCAPLWTAAISGGGATSAAPAVADGIVYVGNSYSGLYAFDASGSTNCSATATGKTCAPLWNAPSATGAGAPAVANGVVYATVGSGELAAFDATASTNCPGTGTVKTCTRAPLWTSAPLAAGYLTASPTVANGVVYVASTGGGLYAYDAAGSLDCPVSDTATSSGTAKACSPLRAGAVTGLIGGSATVGGGSPAIVNGVLFTGSGTIYAYSL